MHQQQPADRIVEPTQPKRRWRPPRLKKYGSLAELTKQTKTQGYSDGQTWQGQPVGSP